MKPKMTKDEHTALIKDALHALLNARIEYDQWRAETATRTVKLEFMTLDDHDWGRLRLKDIIDHPVQTSIRLQMRALGKELYQLLGNTRAMVQVCEDVAGRNPKKHGYRADILDKAWDGIGANQDIWAA
jgi:hypothetical protein